MIALLHDLGASDPGLLLVIGLIFGSALGIVGLAMCMAWGPTVVRERGHADPRPPGVRADRAGRGVVMMAALPDCSAHDDCPRAAFLLLRDLPVCRVGFEELGGVL